MQLNLDRLANLLDLATKSGYARYSSLFLLAQLVRDFKPTRIVELGTYHGCSTIFIADALQPGAKLLSIDSYKQSNHKDVSDTLIEFSVHDKVHLRTGDTRTAGIYIAEAFDGLVDMVFFDASHTDQEVLKEFKSIRPYLSENAVLIFDDALCIPAAIATIGIDNMAMRAYSVNFGLCVMVLS